MNLGWEWTRNVQYTQGKDAHETPLLPGGEVQGLQCWHWKEEDDYVADDVDGGRAEPDCLLIGAVARDRGVPELGDGSAHEHVGADCEETVGDDQGAGSVDGSSHAH